MLCLQKKLKCQCLELIINQLGMLLISSCAIFVTDLYFSLFYNTKVYAYPEADLN